MGLGRTWHCLASHWLRPIKIVNSFCTHRNVKPLSISFVLGSDFKTAKSRGKRTRSRWRNWRYCVTNETSHSYLKPNVAKLNELPASPMHHQRTPYDCRSTQASALKMCIASVSLQFINNNLHRFLFRFALRPTPTSPTHTEKGFVSRKSCDCCFSAFCWLMISYFLQTHKRETCPTMWNRKIVIEKEFSALKLFFIGRRQVLNI